jgi:hypothetical protein
MTRDTTRRIRASLVLATVALSLGCVVSAAGAPTATVTGKPVRYELGPTSRCLKQRGARVRSVQPQNSRLRSFRDLAQKNSIQAELRKGVVAIAFTTSANSAKLLVELLRVPKDPYRIVRRENAVLMYRPAAKGAFTTAASCLRA